MEKYKNKTEKEGNYVECVIKSHLFDGYTQKINLEGICSTSEIIGCVISTLYSIFGDYNLKGLIKHLDDLTFHVENVKFDDIKSGKITRITIVEDEDFSCSSGEEK